MLEDKGITIYSLFLSLSHTHAYTNNQNSFLLCDALCPNVAPTHELVNVNENCFFSIVRKNARNPLQSNRRVKILALQLLCHSFKFDVKAMLFLLFW